MNNTFLMSVTRGILVISVSMMMVFGLNSCSKDELLDDNFNPSPSASKNGNLENMASGGTSTWGDDDDNNDLDDDNGSNDSDDNSSNNSSNDSSDDSNNSNDDNGSDSDDDNGSDDSNNDDGDDDGSDD